MRESRALPSLSLEDSILETPGVQIPPATYLATLLPLFLKHPLRTAIGHAELFLAKLNFDATSDGRNRHPNWGPSVAGN